MTVLTPGCGPNAPIVAGKDARAGTYQTTPSGKLLHSFTLHNTSTTATTRAAARLGLAFLKGDVPKGKKLAVWVKGGRRVPFSAAAAANTWADGSLRSTADGGMVLLDGSLGPGQSRTYEVHVVNGTAPASGFDPFAWLAAHGNDLTVAVTGRTGSATGARPDLLFSLKTAIATTTRREILCDTDRFVRIKAWQKVPQEEHLICEYHVDFWLDEAGQPFGLEFAPVLSQHWWVADPFGQTQTKERYTYDAMVKYGTTVLDSRARLDHAYYCRWASLRPQDDAQHARKHWIGLGLSQMPTVRVQYDNASLKRMMKAGYIPPLRLGVNWSSIPTYATTYTPLATLGHRSNIDGTGDYAGRGIWGNPDARLVSLQGTATSAVAETAWRVSRVMAQAGLSVFFHTRDHRSVNGVNGGTDTTNRLIPQVLRKASALSLSESYGGLAGATVYCDGALENTSGLTTIVQAASTGGTGQFSNGTDNSHAVNYSGPAAFLESEAYLGDAAISCFGRACSVVNFNKYSHDTEIMYRQDNNPRTIAQGIPNGSFGTIIDLITQERNFGWGLNLLHHAYALRAEPNPEQPFIKNMVRNVDYWLSTSYGYWPTNHRSKGTAYITLGRRGVCAPWEQAFQGLAAAQSQRLYDFLPNNARGMNGIEEAAMLAGRYTIARAVAGPYGLGAYRALWGTDAYGLNTLPADEVSLQISVNITGDTFTVIAGPGGNLTWNSNDTVRFNIYTGTGLQALPSGVDGVSKYYIVNPTATSFQISRTKDGPALLVGSISNHYIYVTLKDFAITPIATSIYMPADDSYIPMAVANFEQCIGDNHADMDNDKRDQIRAFFAPKLANFSTYASWNYNGDNLL